MLYFNTYEIGYHNAINDCRVFTSERSGDFTWNQTVLTSNVHETQPYASNESYSTNFRTSSQKTEKQHNASLHESVNILQIV